MDQVVRGSPELRHTSREASFCAHVIAERAPIIVPDTLLDEDLPRTRW